MKPAAPLPPHRLRRRLGFVLLLAYGTGTIVGAGIYVLTGEVIRHAGTSAPLSFLVAAALAALTGLSYAELSARYPEAAGAAAYIGYGFKSDRLARVAGYTVALTGAIGAAAIARGSAAYLRDFVEFPDALLAGGVVVVFFLIACLGVAQSVGVAAAYALIEVGGLVLVIGVGAPSLELMRDRLPTLIPADLAGVTGMLSGAFLAFFAYAGFETMVNMAEETHNPHRTMPRAIVAAIAAAGVLYTLAVLVALLAVSPELLAASDTPLSLVLGEVDWNAPAVISAIGAMATANGVLVEILMVSRLLFGMAEHGWAPRQFLRVTPRSRVPLEATAAAAAAALVLTLAAPIEPLAETTSSLLLVLFGTVNLALWRLHRAGGPAPRGFRAPRWVPPLGCVLSYAMLATPFLG